MSHFEFAKRVINATALAARNTERFHMVTVAAVHQHVTAILSAFRLFYFSVPKQNIHVQSREVESKVVYSRIRFTRHPKGPKKPDEYAGVTNKPNTNTMYLNGRAISREFKNATNMLVDE